jgi:hypothetical protein
MMMINKVTMMIGATSMVASHASRGNRLDKHTGMFGLFGMIRTMPIAMAVMKRLEKKVLRISTGGHPGNPDGGKALIEHLNVEHTAVFRDDIACDPLSISTQVAANCDRASTNRPDCQ